ncbi:MAG: hypothetical protein ACRDCW_18055 [Sarcina sp.]
MKELQMTELKNINGGSFLGDLGRDASTDAGALGIGIQGAEAGAEIGAVGGPVGVAVGTAVGGLIGGIAGGVLGSL